MLASFEELDSGVLYFENVSSAFSAAGKTKNKDGVRNVKVKIDWGKNIKLGTGWVKYGTRLLRAIFLISLYFFNLYA